MKKFFLFVFLSFFVSSGFAVDCQDGMDEKLVRVEASKLDTNMYDKKISANKIEKWDYKSIEAAYTSGRWVLQNEKDENLAVIGVSICADSDEVLNFKNINIGPYCWCNVESVDNYHVSSEWKNVKEYERHKFDETKYENKKDLAKQKEKEAKEKNIQDCMDECSSTCQSRHSSLIRKINGFYTCEKSKHKLQNVRCTVDNKFITAQSILIFDDMAEIRLLGGGSIIFTPWQEKSSDYIGEYENLPIYLRLKNKGIYVGRETYSMKECL